MSRRTTLAVVGRFLAALGWLGALVGGLALLSGGTDNTVSTGLFLAAVGLLGVLLVVRTGAPAGGQGLDRVPSLVSITRLRRVRSDPPGLRIGHVTWARRTEQSRRRLGRELTELAVRRGGSDAADRPALVELRDGTGPADAELIAAAVDAAAGR